MQRLAGFLLGSLVFVYLFCLVISINLLQSLSLAIRPFSRHAFRTINRRLAGFWWGQCVWLADTAGVEVIFTGDAITASENSVLISNHQTMADIPFIFFVAKKAQRIGDMKWYVKDVLKWVPGIGWGMFFLDCIFVKRNWHRDKASIEQTFRNLTQDNVPAMVICFAEGTRCTPHKLAQSQSFAASNHLPMLQHVLLPRAKGFVATVQGMRSTLDAVYDITIGYVDGVPSLWQYAQGHAMRVHLHVRRHPIDELSDDAIILKQWLTDQYAIKDQLLDQYYTSGQFPSMFDAS